METATWHGPYATGRPVGVLTDLSVDPRDAIIARITVENEELRRALEQAQHKLYTLDQILAQARQHTRMHG